MEVPVADVLSVLTTGAAVVFVVFGFFFFFFRGGAGAMGLSSSDESEAPSSTLGFRWRLPSRMSSGSGWSREPVIEWDWLPNSKVLN